MRLTLFFRLILGYLAVFILVLAVSIYAVFQLDRFNVVTRSVLDTDNRVLDYEKKLADALLSQIRYERKFFITKDAAFYDQFLLFKTDFEQYLDDVLSLADAEASGLLENARAHYQSYHELVDREARFLQSGQRYPQSSYQAEKDRAADSILAALEKLRVHSERSTYEKIRALAETGANARRAALLIAGASLIFVIGVSLLITQGITRPILLLERKTRDVAKGDFAGDLNISSPPELAELAGAFNMMCRKLKDLDKMKSDFFSTMSHELRTPLTAMKEGIGLLRDGVGGPVTGKQKNLLAILTEESNRLIGLVNSFLDLSKMEAGMVTYNFEPVSLAPLINKAMIEIGPLVEAKRINLEAEIGEQLPILKADSERILQVLRNLLGNAVKFSPQGGRVIVSARPRNGGVEVKVGDTGPGIPAENLAAIFEKFQQASSQDWYRSQGTGLGLAIVKHVIASHGGQVWAESKLGQGSTFVFVLPA